MRYSRQDKNLPGDGASSIGARVILRMLETMGANQVITIDLHNEEIAQYCNIPIINLPSSLIFLPKLKLQKPFLKSLQSMI
jgi:phosphoribosylpyrophosphate synthetase